MKKKATLEQIENARCLHQCDEIEIDDEALVSEAEDGYWVQAWVWVDPNLTGDWSEEEVLSICQELGLELGAEAEVVK